MTADELLHMPDDGMRHELVRGELRTMPPSGGEHGAITFGLGGTMWQYLKAHPHGVALGAETGFILARDPDTVRAPDLAFIRQERIPPAGIPQTYVPLAPDFVAEVVSPSDRPGEVNEKVAEWLAAGVRLVWVVRPKDRTVTVHRAAGGVTTLTAGDILDGQDVLPGFRCRVADLFI
jgi:Uma2 family endonuclease